jgi:DNA invertase Pin-like site-specific DNA recombinase
MTKSKLNGGLRAATTSRIVGYARVSTADQNLDGQLATLKQHGASVIYQEKASGVRADRPQLAKLLAKLQPGDTLIVARLDRLGRSLRELLAMLADLQANGVAFKSLAENWDTSTPVGKLLISVIGAPAEFERHLLLERTGDGIRRAKARGVKFGRPKVLTAFQAAEARKRREGGEALSLIAQSYRVSAKTIARL